MLAAQTTRVTSIARMHLLIVLPLINNPLQKTRMMADLVQTDSEHANPMV